MKPPDEIKKALEYISITNVAEKVEKFKQGLPYAYTEEVSADALAYIRQLEDHIGDITKKVEQLEAQVQKWISVEERLPKNEVLAANFAPGTFGYKEYIIGYVFAARCSEPGGCYAENEHEILYDVTHWMPLPEAPKEDAT